MPQDVAVITVHGINTSANNYSKDFKKQLSKRLPKNLQPYMYFDEVFWADIIRGRQQGFLKRALQQNVKASQWRDLAMQALGDAAAYQKTRERKNSAYYSIQWRLLEVLENTAQNVRPGTPLILVGHSLGCHIISSFAWDVHKLKAMPTADAQGDDFAIAIQKGAALTRLDTFAAFVTLGNNMPLFTFTFGPSEVHPITHPFREDCAPAFPGAALSSHTRAKATWLNIYSPNDPLGFPLKPLNDAYKDEPLLRDVPHAVEGIRMNAYDAHIRYWSNRFVHRETAKVVQSIIEAGDHTPSDTGR